MGAYVNTDGGRAESLHPTEKNDCAVLCMALAFGLTYDEAHAFCRAEMGRKMRDGAHIDQYLKANPVLFDRRAIHHTFPAVEGEPRMRLKRFVDEYRNGVWIVGTTKHCSIVIDGVYYDCDVKPDLMMEEVVYSAFEIVYE